MSAVLKPQPEVKPYLLLKPVKTSSQYASWHLGLLVTAEQVAVGDLSALLPGIDKADYIAVDFETNGTFLPDQNVKPVGVGLCWRTKGRLMARYVSFKKDGKADNVAAIKDRRKLYKYLASLSGKLVAHNLMFDGTLFKKELGSWPDNLYWDTLALARHLATEGWKGQSHGLKNLMQELLGWPESNEQDLDNWLAAAYPDTKKDYRKSMMYTAPDHILGRYCVQDVEATLLLFEKVLKPALDNTAGPSYLAYYDVFLRHLKRISDSYMTGIRIDKKRLAEYYCKLKMQLDDVYSEWRAIPTVAAGIKAYNKMQVDELLRSEPARLTKDNDVSKVWLAWYDRLETARNTDHFSETSAVQLRWLFFDYLGKKPFKMTDKGLPSTDEESLKHLGTEGKQLVEAKAFEKMVTAFLWPHLDRHIKRHGKDEDGNYLYRVHPNYRVPGTYTGRLGGSTPNYQQLPKDAEFLSCLLPAPGNVFIDNDVNSLEQVVMTELTRDKTLWKLYGPEAQANDVYLFVGSQLPVIGPKLRRYYDPNNPTPESIAAAKKNCKSLRSIAKVTVLSCILEGTPILTSTGIKRIEDITSQDLIWDGTAWASTQGAIFKGYKQVTSLRGSWMTSNHRILGDDNEWRTQEEWTMEEGDCSAQPKRPDFPSRSWSDVWQLVCGLFRG